MPLRDDESRRAGGSSMALRAAFPATIPVMTGFLCLGTAYGLLMQSKGYGPGWSVLMSAIAFGGSMQFVAVTLLTTAFDPVQAFLLSVMVNARHMFYGLSLLDKYKGLGKVRAFLIYVLCDETFSLVSTLEPPEGVARRDFYFWISLLDYLYWITGTALGGLLGSFLTFDTTGLDFALTALFVVLFLEQWKKPENRPAGVMGILCAGCQPGGVRSGQHGDPRYGAGAGSAAGCTAPPGPQRRGGGPVTLTPLQTLGIILAVAAGTQLTRWLPFWLFPEKKQPPAVVAYLGKVLPPAMMGLLVVYCLRSISWLSAPHGAPELIAIAAVAGLHLWKRNVLLSIAGGTVLYMVLVQAVFV